MMDHCSGKQQGSTGADNRPQFQGRVSELEVHIFTSNPETTSKFLGSKRCHEASFIRRTRKSGVTSKRHCYLALSTRCIWTESYVKKIQ